MIYYAYGCFGKLLKQRQISCDERARGPVTPVLYFSFSISVILSCIIGQTLKRK